MSGLPPAGRLKQVVSSIAGSLPQEFAHLLQSERLQEEKEAVSRLGVAGRVEEALDRMPDAEADWLAGELLKRWAAIAEVKLEPAAALLGPRRPDPGTDVRLEVVVDGLEEGWQAVWPEQAEIDPDVPAAAVIAVPDLLDRFSVTVRVMGKSSGRRQILTASWTPER